MATLAPAAVAGDGGDPRLSVDASRPPMYSAEAQHVTGAHPGAQLIHDPSILVEEYMYYAKLSREEERHLEAPAHPWLVALGISKKNKSVETLGQSSDAAGDEKTGKTDSSAAAVRQNPVSDAEWYQAQRAARTAGWSAMFFLITTDILGPFSVPWALTQMGYGEGIALYTVFGVMAFYAGWQLWRMFLQLDSTKYPLRSIGDIAFRVYGPIVRHCLNFLQALQLIFNVGVIIIGNGQGLWQINSKICYTVCCVIWAVCGMVIGQIRTLQRFGWIANIAVWMNVTVMIMTMVVVTHYAPDYADAAILNNFQLTNPITPVHVSGKVPAGSKLTDQIVGLMQAVYSYGGAMLYCEFLSEMRRPMDFWKAIVCAESFIYGCYLFFGVYVYSFQGQYTVNPANQGLSLRGPLVAGNIISLLSALIAAGLYGNIGIKVIYNNLLQEFLNFPDLTSTKGKFAWIACVPVYWAIAFVLAAAIPNFSALSALVAALCILQFSYTFPPMLMVGLETQRDAVQPGEGFDPATNTVIRHDSGWRRWRRGFLAGNVYVKCFNTFFFLGSFVTMVLGVYSAIVGIIDAFAAGYEKPFGCTP